MRQGRWPAVADRATLAQQHPAPASSSIAQICTADGVAGFGAQQSDGVPL